MEYPELSLGLSNAHLATKRTIEANNPSKKRKLQGNNLNLIKEESLSSFIVETTITNGAEKNQTAHAENWKQQWHDHQTGRVYTLNRNTMNKKSCSHCQKAPNLDLELNFSSSEGRSRRSCDDDLKIQQASASSNSSSDNMVAMGCFKCNQLVMLSRSFPSCPNCKYVHSLPMTDRQSQPRTNVKSFHTLSLLN